MVGKSQISHKISQITDADILSSKRWDILPIAYVGAAQGDFLLKRTVWQGGAEDPSRWAFLTNATSASHQVTSSPISQADMMCPSAALLRAPAAPGSLGKGPFFINTSISTAPIYSWLCLSMTLWGGDQSPGAPAVTSTPKSSGSQEVSSLRPRTERGATVSGIQEALPRPCGAQ